MTNIEKLEAIKETVARLEKGITELRKDKWGYSIDWTKFVEDIAEIANK